MYAQSWNRWTTKEDQEQMKKNLFVTVTLVLALAVAVGAAAPAVAAGSHTTGPAWMTNANPPYKGFVRGWALISAAQLKALCDAQQAWNNKDTIAGDGAPKQDPKLVIIDVAKPTEEYMAEGHIPGSYNIWRHDYESPEKLFGVRGENLMAMDQFQTLLRSFGIDNDSQVIFLDHKYDATRLWWACKYYGFNVRVLDGGFKAWKDAGYEVNHLAAPAKPAAGDLVLPGPGGMATLLVDTDAVWHCRDNSEWDLWDLRSMQEITGERKRAKRMGRIPWDNGLVPWKTFHAEDGTWKDAKTMQALFDQHGFNPAHHSVFYCQSGVRTTQGIFSLYLMGFPLEHLHNYDSSWIYWGNAPDTPIVNEKGEPVLYKP
jgi:thiosulfate/3-mercaptopyruvate sulfurtransferase